MSQSQTVNIHDAKSQLSKLIDSVESHALSSVIIARAGKPVAKLVALEKPAIRLGLATGKYAIPEPDAELDQDIANTFNNSKIG